KYPDQYEHIRTYFSSVSFSTGSKIKFNTNAYWRRNLDRFELFREDKNWYEKQGELYINQTDTAGFPTPNGLYPYKGHNYHRTDIIGADATVRFNTILGSSSLSIGLKSEQIVSNVLGEPIKDTIFIGGSDGYYNKSKTRNNANFSINQFYSIDKLSASVGLLAFYSDDFGVHISPGIDLGYFVTNSIKVYASANHAIRLPSFTDLYYQGPTNNSNPNLKPETSISSEVGIKYFNNDFNASLSSYYRMGNSVIDWIKYSPEEKWQSANLSSLNTYGVSFSANKQFDRGLINYAGIKYSWLNSEKNNNDIISLYALDFLKHNVNLFVSHSIIKNLKASWTTTLQKRNGSYVDYSTGIETPYATVFLLNLKLLYVLQNIEFSISGSNLLNKKYYDIGNVKQPGLWIIGGLKIKFDR
ncbi:MAG: TonB-dependent receptor, partial [Bacteroidetes bacterium]|nr:TonB-dependent receptor [Bacteroidota bacterium]